MLRQKPFYKLLSFCLLTTKNKSTVITVNPLRTQLLAAPNTFYNEKLVGGSTESTCSINLSAYLLIIIS